MRFPVYLVIRLSVECPDDSPKEDIADLVSSQLDYKVEYKSDDGVEIADTEVIGQTLDYPL